MGGSVNDDDDEDEVKEEEIIWDVVIVGAGVMGSACAWRLAKQQQQQQLKSSSKKLEKMKRILLLDQFNANGGHDRGSSHGHSRIIRRTYPEGYYTQAMARSYELWEEVDKEAAAKMIPREEKDPSSDEKYYCNHRPLFHKTGGLDFGPKDNVHLKELIESCVDHNVPHEVLSASDVSERFPAFVLPSDTHYAVYQPDAGLIEASKSVKVFQELAVSYGVGLTIRSNTSLTNMTKSFDSTFGGDLLKLHVIEKKGRHNDKKKNNNHNVGCCDGEQKEEDKNANKFISIIIKTQSVVLTTGAWSNKLLSSSTDGNGGMLDCLQGTPLSRIPLRPRKVSAMYWKVKSNVANEDIQMIGGGDGDDGGDGECKFPVFIDYERGGGGGAYGLPSFEHPRHLKICDHDGPSFDNPNNRDNIDNYDSAINTVRRTLRFLPGVIENDDNDPSSSSQQPHPSIVEHCMYTMTPDEDFVIDSVDLTSYSSSEGEGEEEKKQGNNNNNNPLIVCVGTGFSGHGFKFAPLVGDVLASLSQNQVPNFGFVDMNHFSASRAFPDWS